MLDEIYTESERRWLEHNHAKVRGMMSGETYESTRATQEASGQGDEEVLIRIIAERLNCPTNRDGCIGCIENAKDIISIVKQYAHAKPLEIADIAKKHWELHKALHADDADGGKCYRTERDKEMFIAAWLEAHRPIYEEVEEENGRSRQIVRNKMKNA